MRIGVVSDIHGSYQSLIYLVNSVKLDMIIHAGDGVRDIEQLSSGAFSASMIRAVRGNCDISSYSGLNGIAFPQELFFPLAGWNIFLTHGHNYGVKSGLNRLRSRGRELGADIIVFGHTHIPLFERAEDIMLLNPGSLSLGRCYGKPSYGLLEITPERVNAEIMYMNFNK